LQHARCGSPDVTDAKFGKMFELSSQR
jgi:hypothetical protein